MNPSWFQAFVQRVRDRRSLPSVESWVAAHSSQLPPTAVAGQHAAKSAACTPKATYSARNDARTTAGASGGGVDLCFPPDDCCNYNIFADLALHDQAAATIASASMVKSGFTNDMPELEEGVALENFMAYLNDFLAPHWMLSFSHQQEVQHESTNHDMFVEDLVNIVVNRLRAVGGDEEGAAKAAESVRKLSKRLASKNSLEDMLTLFATFWMERPNSTDPVVYCIFYIAVQASYKEDGKAKILSTTITTYSVTFELVSGVLIQYAQVYNRLPQKSVKFWLERHEI